MLRVWIGRTLLLTATAAYMAGLALQYMGERALDPPTPENLSRGLRWRPVNPALWTALGRYWLFAPDGSQPRQAADAFLKAAALNPLDPENWNGLAAAYQQLGEYGKVETALRSNLAAMPHAPQAAWRLANGLLFQGRSAEALPYLQSVAVADRSLRPAVFDLGWKILNDPERILHEVVPASLEARADYFQFLIGRSKLPAADPVWQELRSARFPQSPQLGYAYIEALLGARQTSTAARVWGELLADTGRSAAKPAGELLTNGDFEADMPNAGLDWLLTTDSHYAIALDNFVWQSGSRSLRVVFDGESNPDFIGVRQSVPVDPNTEYLLRGYLRTENISSDSGLRFAVMGMDGPAEERFTLYSENRLGSNPWTIEEIHFRTGPKTTLVLVALRRLFSRKLNNRLEGKVWIDNVSVRALESVPPGRP